MGLTCFGSFPRRSSSILFSILNLWYFYKKILEFFNFFKFTFLKKLCYATPLVVERSWSLRIITYLITISMWQINYKWLSKFLGKMVCDTSWSTGNLPLDICLQLIQWFPPFLIFKHTHRNVRLFHLKSFRQTTKRRLHSMQCSVCVSIFQYWNLIGRFVCFTFVTQLVQFYWARITELFS